MGSGCGSSPNNFFNKSISDQTVTYTGPAISSLGICTNDKLSEVEAVLLQKILDYSTGVGISLPNIDLSTCALFIQSVVCCTSCTDLACVMQAYLTALCTLFGDFQTLQAEVTALLTGPYNTYCLTLGTNPTLSQIIQELLKEYCTLYTQVQTLQTTVNNLSSGLPTTIGNFLSNALKTCQSNALVTSGVGASFTATIKGIPPIGTIFMYAGSTSGLFDGTGLGLSGTAACGYAFANGNNGTIDMRGFVPVGVINGMGGGTLDTHVVDTGATPSAVYSLGDTVGAIRTPLVAANIPSMPVTINDPGHGHNYTYYFQGNGGAGSQIVILDKSYPGVAPPATVPPDDPIFTHIDSNTTGITASLSGGSTPVENRQPSKALYFIQRIA